LIHSFDNTKESFVSAKQQQQKIQPALSGIVFSCHFHDQLEKSRSKGTSDLSQAAV
jgi:hypothetical protein